MRDKHDAGKTETSRNHRAVQGVTGTAVAVKLELKLYHELDGKRRIEWRVTIKLGEHMPSGIAASLRSVGEHVDNFDH